MGLNYLLFIWVAVLVVSTSSFTVNSQVQGCSLVGIVLQNCLVSSSKTPFSVDSCCSALNQALQAGYYCLCSLIGPSEYPVFNTDLAVCFSNCHISIPSLAHCHGLEPNPVVTAPPAAAQPQLNQSPPLLPSPLLPVLMPPGLPRDDTVVPFPPKVNEMPLNSRGDNSSIVDSDPTFSSSPLPKLGVPERWDHLSSDGANVKMLLYSRNLLILALFSYSIA